MLDDLQLYADDSQGLPYLDESCGIIPSSEEFTSAVLSGSELCVVLPRSKHQLKLTAFGRLVEIEHSAVPQLVCPAYYSNVAFSQGLVQTGSSGGTDSESPSSALDRTVPPKSHKRKARHPVKVENGGPSPSPPRKPEDEENV